LPKRSFDRPGLFTLAGNNFSAWAALIDLLATKGTSVQFYEKYKPFRNYMRKFDLVSGLVDVWRYSLNVMEGQPLPADYAVGAGAMLKPLKEHFYPWDLDILAKELVLNAGKGGDRSLKTWSHLAVAVNHIRQLEDAAYMDNGAEPPDVIFELHRIAHRQFPWQMSIGMAPMIRAFKVFGESAVEAIVVRELGMTVRQFLLLGAAVGGSFRRKWGMSTNQDYAVLGISREASDAFFRRITCTAKQLKAETGKRQSYGRDWPYTWNPLEATPLVAFDPAFPDRVLCPIPRYLLRRASAGIFYDLVNLAGFDNPFGDSFQTYVGEVIRATCPAPRFTALAEESYYLGKSKMHGVDWVLSDSTGHLFIECKTKRLTLNARTLSDSVALDRDLDVMAKAIVQHYRNIGDALERKTRWVPNGLPIYPLVLTLEDWFIFSPRVAEKLRDNVCRLLAEAGIPEKVLVEMPYTIASAHEFEIVSQIMAQVGIFSVMAKKTSPEQQGLSLLPLARNDFSEEMRRINWRLFAQDWARMMPNVPDD
jgi:hypothetical protein